MTIHTAEQAKVRVQEVLGSTVAIGPIDKVSWEKRIYFRACDSQGNPLLYVCQDGKTWAPHQFQQMEKMSERKNGRR